MSFFASPVIFPDPAIVMSLPEIAIVPSFFIRILASPVLIKISSAASIDSFFPTLSESFPVTLTSRLPPTFSARSLAVV